MKYDGIFARLRSDPRGSLPRPVHWSTAAVCKDPDLDPETFFPVPTDPLAVENAKSYCRRCPVEMRCRTDALNRGEEHGVWGGLDEDELRAVRKVRRAAAAKEKQAAQAG
ncbi:WhiB family transcriptional regulator [Streptomyces sp. SAI-127]|uniref:WhiB family transcriptional regulator n=1 Tax=Streptomyces sp. SAI-127 TaxID=2940543 RepID=UPI002472EAF5|nr:WhiB family transcriptional regulator [Streptomyces sp. SAI-127]MDH6489583.1 WhiB family redox-sensing transcriptional regulator [Streptomyces sp. SAI-127]